MSDFNRKTVCISEREVPLLRASHKHSRHQGSLMLINQLHQLIRFIDPAGRRVNRSDDSVGVIDHSVVLVPWPSLNPS